VAVDFTSPHGDVGDTVHLDDIVILGL